MNADQRRKYFRYTWPQACAGQGWNPRDEARRQEATVEAERLAGVKEPTGSTTLLHEAVITVLFRYLEHLARPDNVAARMALDEAIKKATVRPAFEQEQFVRQILAMDFAEAYLRTVARAWLLRAGVEDWRELPAESLEKIFFTLNTRRRDKARKEAKSDPRKHYPEERKEPWHQRVEGREHRRWRARLEGAFACPPHEITPLMEDEWLAAQPRDTLPCICRTCQVWRGVELPEDADELDREAVSIPLELPL